jgi:hypothetical protein
VYSISVSISLHPSEKAKSYLTLIGIGFSLIASLYAGAMTVWGQIGQVVTREDLSDHNLLREAHPPLRDRYDACEDQARLALKRVEELRADQVMMMGRLARIIAADMERDPRKRAMRAEAAENALKRRVRHGEALEDAFVMALSDARDE